MADDPNRSRQEGDASRDFSKIPGSPNDRSHGESDRSLSYSRPAISYGENEGAIRHYGNLDVEEPFEDIEISEEQENFYREYNAAMEGVNDEARTRVEYSTGYPRMSGSTSFQQERKRPYSPSGSADEEEGPRLLTKFARMSTDPNPNPSRVYQSEERSDERPSNVGSYLCEDLATGEVVRVNRAEDLQDDRDNVVLTGISGSQILYFQRVPVRDTQSILPQPQSSSRSSPTIRESPPQRSQRGKISGQEYVDYISREMTVAAAPTFMQPTYDSSSTASSSDTHSTRTSEPRHQHGNLLGTTLVPRGSFEIPEEFTVVVIGAGISGLGAAKFLKTAGLNVSVVEARDRVGGRIHSTRMEGVGNLETISIDLGANYLMGCEPKNALFQLSVDLGIPSAESIGGYGWESPDIAEFRTSNGESLSHQQVANCLLHLDNILTMGIFSYKESFKEYIKDESKFTKIMESIEAEKIIRLGLDEYNEARQEASLCEINKIELDATFTIIARLFSYVAELNRLSGIDFLTSSYAETTDPKYYFPPSESMVHSVIKELGTNLKKVKKASIPKLSTKAKIHDRLVAGRFGDIPDELAKSLDVKLNFQVRTIEYDSSCVKITSISGQVIKCKYCICTLPLNVLNNVCPENNVTFIPPLPTDKHQILRTRSCSAIGMKTHEKVFLRYNEVFWNNSVPAIHCINLRITFANLHFHGKTNLLMAHIWAGSKVDIYRKSDLDIVKQLDSELALMYPNKEAHVVSYHVTRWAEDKYSLNAYYAEYLGASEDDFEILRRPLPDDNPRLYFAGDGTVSRQQENQCTIGAFKSGTDVARKIVSKEGIDTSEIYDEHMVRWFAGKFRPRRKR